MLCVSSLTLSLPFPSLPLQPTFLVKSRARGSLHQQLVCLPCWYVYVYGYKLLPPCLNLTPLRSSPSPPTANTNTILFLLITLNPILSCSCPVLSCPIYTSNCSNALSSAAFPLSESFRFLSFPGPACSFLPLLATIFPWPSPLVNLFFLHRSCHTPAMRCLICNAFLKSPL